MKTGHLSEALLNMSKHGNLKNYRMRLEALIGEACLIINRVRYERDALRSEVIGIKETSVT